MEFNDNELQIAEKKLQDPLLEPEEKQKII